jgi:DNA polymerase-3 subunit epsilon
MLDAPLSDLTFVALDLETTGRSAGIDGITEVGAVKSRGGEVIGEFSTLINPGVAIPPFITVLTGITDAMVAEAPRVEEVLPSLLEFLHGSVFVAHNAPFDLGFLRASTARHGYSWPNLPVVDTLPLARRLIRRGDAPNHKLSTLARLFRTSSTPRHRALGDAEATLEVLFGLLELVGNQGVETLGDLLDLTVTVPEAQRRKRYLARDLPRLPGVYIFRDAEGRPLYIGTSGNIRQRVGAYFSTETRTRMTAMVAAADRVEAVVCSHPLHAAITELRLLSAEKPPYNRRSTTPERVWWLRLTDDAFPRLSVVPTHRVGLPHLGPFPSKSQAVAAQAAVQTAIPLRQCTGRLPRGCHLAEIDRCSAPCLHAGEYAPHVATATEALRRDPTVVVETLLARLGHLAAEQRYEVAGELRHQLHVFLRGALRGERLTALTQVEEVVAGHLTEEGWELVVVRRGRLCGAGTAPHDDDTLPKQIAVLLDEAEEVTPLPGNPLPCATAAETEMLLAWLTEPETVLFQVTGAWISRTDGPRRWQGLELRLAEAAGA